MKKTDFIKHNIDHFSSAEIEATGACLQDVDVSLFIRLNEWRKSIQTPVKLIFNGLTTGTHNSKEHKIGKAVDCYPVGGQPDGYYLWYHQAIKVGFSGIGVYYNKSTKLITYHLDLGSYRSWIGTKRCASESWRYSALIRNPINII